MKNAVKIELKKAIKTRYFFITVVIGMTFAIYYWIFSQQEGSSAVYTGTLSVDLDSENNIIKVAAISPRSKEDIIPFEKYIKKMLE